MTGTTIEVTEASLDEANDNETFLQTGTWGRFKQRHGWKARAFSVTWNAASETRREIVLVLTKALRASFVLAYVPHGPSASFFESDDEIEARLSVLSDRLRPFLPRGTVSIRWDLSYGTKESIVVSESEDEDFQPDGAAAAAFPRRLGKPLRKPASDVQPPDTVVLDLESTEERLLASMKKKTRYNVRLAEKKGVEVRVGGIEDVDAWYALYLETAQRDKIAVHSRAYYRDWFETTLNDPTGPRVYLLLAYWQGRLIAGNVVSIHKRQGVYLYGASSNEHRNVMAPYLLQWESIRLCKARGCATYDLFGIPPTRDERHPMHGLYRFKTGFGGRIEHRFGAWDYVLKPTVWFWLDRADKLRTWYYKTWKKR